jgi:hypothetical protein
MQRRAEELEDFKSRINLGEYAAACGYRLDRKATSRNSAVMVHSPGDKIIIALGAARRIVLLIDEEEDVIERILRHLGPWHEEVRVRLSHALFSGQKPVFDFRTYFCHSAPPWARFRLHPGRQHPRRAKNDFLLVTWDRITIADAWLPQPRILHPWPDQRFAVMQSEVATASWYRVSRRHDWTARGSRLLTRAPRSSDTSPGHGFGPAESGNVASGVWTWPLRAKTCPPEFTVHPGVILLPHGGLPWPR